MQSEPIAITAPPSGRVRGLGVCDALRLELDAVQVPWLIDELEETRGPLEEELQHVGEDENGQRERCLYELRLLRLMRAQLPAADHTGPAVWHGPSGMVCELAHATLARVAETLAEFVGQGRGATAEGRERLRELGAAVQAWAHTVADCHDVELFRFDPDADPHARW